MSLDRTRTLQIGVRMSQREMDELDYLANTQRLSRSAYVRSFIMHEYKLQKSVRNQGIITDNNRRV